MTDIRSIKEVILSYLSSINKRKLQRSGVSSADYFWGLKQGGNVDEKDILQFIDYIKCGTTEIMCHPGYADNKFNYKYSHWNYNPAQELRALTSEVVKEKLKANKIKLVF
jgi:predicted glycoside hydrolase/deacetylase ChbG (UPF0249 family)